MTFSDVVQNNRFRHPRLWVAQARLYFLCLVG